MTELKKLKGKSKEKLKPKSVVAAGKIKKAKPVEKASAKPKEKKILHPVKVSRPVKVVAGKRKGAEKEKKKEKPALTTQKPTLEPTVLPAKPQEPQTVVPRIATAVPKPDIAPPKISPKKEIKESKPALAGEPAAVPAAVSAPAAKELELKLPVTVKDLAIRLQEKPSVLIKMLMDLKIMAAINQPLDDAIVGRLGEKLGFKIIQAPTEEETMLAVHAQTDSPTMLLSRSPIVTLMGHVDHGKTSLLDAIRKSKVTESEHGGITQHIGAYRVILPHGEITFLDTPGHEAFTAMRARGAKITDIVVLVVAADEGIMPQTQEAIDHARAAGVTIMVAVNKIDKPASDVDRVKKQLAELGLTPEDWGGKTITVGVSAKTGQGIDELLEMILLEASMLEVKANPARLARGIVIEAKQHKYKGPLATLLVQNGTLRLNEYIIVGKWYGKIRAMFNDRGQSTVEAGPGIPVEVMGISGLPDAGEQFFVIEDEKKAKELAAKRQQEDKDHQMRPVKRMGLEDLYSQIKEGKLKELKLIIKADAQGSLEAIKDVLGKIPNAEITLTILHEGIGNINGSDVILAVASNALILGFNVVADDTAKELIAKEGQEVRTYNIIYELANDIRAALEGMLEPKLKKIFLGRVEVRKMFKLSRSGTIAGCFVSKGKVMRSALVSLVRNGAVVFEGELASLKRFKDDVREVAEGFECGIALKGFDAVEEGDLIEVYQIEKIARKLD